MNATSESPSNKTVEPIAGSSKFVMGSFFAFFLVIAAIVTGDFIAALIR